MERERKREEGRKETRSMIVCSSWECGLLSMLEREKQ
jgi:hypothetical protein